MTAPDLRVAIEPNNAGTVHYLRCAPSVAGGSERGLLSMALTLENVGASKVHIHTVAMRIGGSPTLPLPQPVDWTLDPYVPGASPYWVSVPSDQQFVIPAGAATLTLRLFADGFGEPAVIQRALAAHSSPTDSGSYRFWGAVRDLRPGEFWAVDGLSHAQGNPAQVYAYDVNVGVESASGYDMTMPGSDPARNESYRIWNKPIYAVADGKVRQFRNDFPTNQVAGQVDPEIEKFWTSVADGGDGKDGNGNFFTIESGSETVLYAHLIAGSLNPKLLAAGAAVRAGDYLGRAGNSGASGGPHLHIHANRSSVHDQSWYEMPRPMPMHGARAVAWSSLGADARVAPWVLLNGRGVAPTSCAIWPSGGLVVNLREVQLRHFTLGDDGQLWAVKTDNKVRLTSEGLPPDGLVGAYLDQDPAGLAKEVALLGAKPYLIGMDDRVWEGQASRWAPLSGSPTCRRIAADPYDGRIWVVTLDGRIMTIRPGSGSWNEYPGDGRAKDICVRRGRAFVIGLDDKIWQSQGASGWAPLPGAGKGKRIAIDSQDGKLWVVGMNDGIWSHSGGGNWIEHAHAGRARELFVHRGTPFIIGMDNALWRSVGAHGWFRMNVVEPD